MAVQVLGFIPNVFKRIQKLAELRRKGLVVIAALDKDDMKKAASSVGEPFIFPARPGIITNDE